VGATRDVFLDAVWPSRRAEAIGRSADAGRPLRDADAPMAAPEDR
jgi:hypothetical protein